MLILIMVVVFVSALLAFFIWQAELDYRGQLVKLAVILAVYLGLIFFLQLFVFREVTYFELSLQFVGLMFLFLGLKNFRRTVGNDPLFGLCLVAIGILLLTYPVNLYFEEGSPVQRTFFYLNLPLAAVLLIGPAVVAMWPFFIIFFLLAYIFRDPLGSLLGKISSLFTRIRSFRDAGNR